MKRRAAIILIALFLLCGGGWNVCRAESSPAAHNSQSRLLALGRTEFSDLTAAESTLLEFVDIRNRNHGDFAPGGPSAVATDASNNPEFADKWGHEREVRADLIRWLCVNPDAAAMIDPRGIRLLGARLTGKLDLSHVRVPFGLTLIRCSIPERINFDSTQLANLDLNASYTGEIYAPTLVVHGDADIGWDGYNYGNKFQASGEVVLDHAQIEGAGGLTMGFARFHRSPQELVGGYNGPRSALYLSGISTKSDVVLGYGSEFDGTVVMDNAKIGGALVFSAGRFTNPGAVALGGISLSVAGDVYLTRIEGYGDFVADGMVEFPAAYVRGVFWVNEAKFLGKRGTPHGLNLSGAIIDKGFGWQNVELQNGATLTLFGARVQSIVDDEKSWPQPGNLILDGLIYNALSAPNDAASRLRWLKLEPSGLHLQPYRQLAKFLNDVGDNQGATRVLIEREDSRYANSGLGGALFGGFLKWTIGYGHRPLLTLFWALAVVSIGSVIVTVASRAGVMRQTWPEMSPDSSKLEHEPMHPFLYSLDVFLPFVNLHQEHYWWPKTGASGEIRFLGLPIRCRGSVVRYYLWGQIVAGWLLSAIFVAGVTGLIRND